MNAILKPGRHALPAVTKDPVARFKELIATPQAGFTARQHERNMRSLVMYAKAAFPEHRVEFQRLIDEAFPKPTKE